MKKFSVALLFFIGLSGCIAPGPESKKVEDFCAYVVQLLKENKKEEFLKLYMTDQESLRFLQSLNITEKQRQASLEDLFASVRQGDYNPVTRSIWYDNIRRDVGDDFLQHCFIGSYLNTKIQEQDGYQMSKPVIILESGHHQEKMLLGNLVFYENRWRILKGPWWMDF